MPPELTREEQAQLEMGHTTVSPAVQRALTLSFLVFIASMLVVETFRGPGGPSVPEGLRVDRLLPDLAELRSVRDWRDAGALLPSVEELVAFEDTLEERSLLRAALLPPIQAFLTGVLRTGNEEAVVGAPGWLFYRPDVDTVTGEPFLDRERHARLWRQEGRRAGERRHDPLAAILDFRDQLELRGIALVVLPVPGKAQIHPERLVADVSSARPLQNPSFEEFLRQLAELEVRCFDPSELLWETARAEEKAYLATDTHWTPAAVAAVARSLSDFLVAADLVERGAPGSFASRAREHRAAGDVATMLRLPARSDLYAPEAVTVEEVRDSKGELWQPHAESSVLLLGDSFTNLYSLEAMGFGSAAGLAEHLSLALQLPLDRISRNGGGALATREALAAELRRPSGAERLASTRVVVFQFAARELLLGDWSLVELPDATARAAPAEPAASAARVSASIVAIRRPPDPTAAPYEDAVVALHLRGVSARGGASFPGEVVAYALGMAKRRWTGFSELEAGKPVELDLVPWDDVREAYDGLHRMELADPDFTLIDLPLYWATLPPPQAER